MNICRETEQQTENPTNPFIVAQRRRRKLLLPSFTSDCDASES